MGDPFKAAIKLHTLLMLQGNFPPSSLSRRAVFTM